MNNDLIERYLYAVTRRMNRKQRDDVAQELRSLIEDMLTERCGAVTPTDKDIRVVLTELGTPQELYAKYEEDADKCLIGQPYYSTYLYVLKIVLISILVGLTIAHFVLALVEPRDVLTAVSGWLNTLWNSAFSAFAFVTLLFAFFYHKGIRINEPFNLDDLPPVPKKKEEVSKMDSIVGIGFDVVFLAVFLAAPQLLGMYTGETGEIIPIFNVTEIRSGWYIILTYGGLGILREIIKLTEGRYNRKVLAVTVVVDLLSAVLAIWWLTGANVFNPVFTQSILAQTANDGAIVMEVFENFPRFFLGVMLFALALDLMNAIVKVLKK